MMDGSIQGAILCAQRYLANRADPNLLIQLENKLDSLNAICQDLASSNTSILSQWMEENMITMEWFAYCHSLLSCVEPIPTSLSQKLIGFLTHFAWYSIVAREYLQSELSLVPTLTVGLMRDGRSRSDLLEQYLKLIQILTYKWPMSEASPELLVFLLKVICQDKTSDSSTDTLRYSLGILNNFCSQSVATRDFVRKTDLIGTLFRTLVNLLQDSNRDVVINCISLIMVLDENLREKIFSGRNLPQTFQCAFNVLIKGDQFMARHYAIDLFIRVVDHPSTRQALATFRPLDQSLINVCSLLVHLDVKRELFRKIFELLLRFCKVEVLRRQTCTALMKAGPVDNRLISPLVAVIECARSPVEQCVFLDLPSKAMKLLKIVVEEIVGSGHRLADYISTDVLLQVMEECLKTTIETGRPYVAAHKSKRIVHCLRLATIASRDDAEFRTDLMEVITSALCGHLAEFQLISNPIVSFAGIHSKNSEFKRLEDSQRWQGIGAQILFGLIEFLRLQEQYSKNHREQCWRLLKDARVLPFLAYGLTSQNKKTVQQAFQISCIMAQDEEFPHAWMGDLIAQNNKRIRDNRGSAVANPCENGSALNGMDEKSRLLSSAYLTNGSSMAIGNAGDALSIDELITSMKSSLNVHDTKISQIMEVYERKIAIMEAKEREFQELLKARTSALQQGDRLLNQYRSNRNEVEQETSKLRSMLRETESKCEKAIAQLSVFQTENEKLRTIVAHAEKQLQEKDQELEARRELESNNDAKLRNLTDALEASRREMESDKELYEVLRRNYDKIKQNLNMAYAKATDAENESKQLKEACKNLTDKNTELTASISNKDERLDQLERKLDQLQSTLQAVEREKKQLQHQTTENERELSRKSGLIKEQEKSIQKLKQELDEYSKILETMHKLTAKGSSKP